MVEVATPVQMAELMKTKSNDELGNAAIDAVKKTFKALASLTNTLFDASIKFSSSEDGKVSSEMASKSVDSLKVTGENLQQALKITTDTWKDTVKEDADAAKFIDGAKAVANSRDVRAALKGATSGASESATSAIEALKVVASGVGEELQTDKGFDAAAMLQEALTELGAILAVGGTRAVGAIQEQSRMLPDGK